MTWDFRKFLFWLNYVEQARQWDEETRKMIERPVDPDAGSELSLAGHLLQEAQIPWSVSTMQIVASAIKAESSTRGGTQKAAEFILKRAIEDKRRGERVNRFWFEDQKYLDGLVQAGVVAQKEETRADYEKWLAQPEDYRKAHRWVGRIPE